MRRLFLPLVLLALTGTLLAQTPQPTPRPQPGGLLSTVSALSITHEGQTTHMKGARFEFEHVTITADEAAWQGHGPMHLSGNVELSVE